MGKVVDRVLISVTAAAVLTTVFFFGVAYEQVSRSNGPTVALPSLPDAVHKRPEGLRELFTNVVMVDSPFGHGTGLYCRGLDPKGTDRVLVVTSAHVVAGVDRVRLIHEDGRAVRIQEGKVIYRADPPDIALIEPIGEIPGNCPVITLLDGQPTLGEPVWFCGLIDGHSLALETTIVSSTSQWIADQPYYGITGVTYPGSSGSCVFVQRDGKLLLLGLVTCGRRGTVAPTWINTNDQIRDWLATLK